MGNEAEETRVVTRKPLAFGGWEFTFTGPATKTLCWFPGDAHLMSDDGRPFLGVPVPDRTAKSARAAAEGLAVRLSEPEPAGRASSDG